MPPKIMPRRRTRGRRPKTRKARVPRSGTSKHNPFAALVVTGVRSLISALPGSTLLSPIVDMFFSSIGFTSKATSVSTTGLTAATGVAFYGLTGMTVIKYANILARSPGAARNTSGVKVQVDSPFTDAKLENIRVTALPDTKQQSRSGRWSIAFIPYRNVNDHSELTKNYQPMPFAQVQALAGSSTTSADKPLTLTFRPRPEDGYIYQFNNISSYFGMLVVAYSEEIRTSYHEFTADDFAPNVTIRGTLKLRQPTMTGTTQGYVDETFSFPSQPPSRIYSLPDKKWFWYSGKEYKCTKDSDGSCKVVGGLYIYTDDYQISDSLQQFEIS